MRTRSQCCLAGGCVHPPGFDGIATRARRRPLRKRNPDGARSTGNPNPEPEVTEWRDWANLTTVFVEDIAGRLLSADVSEYLRFRAVCAPWRELTDDPGAHGFMDGRFRPRNWFSLSKQAAAPSRLRLKNRASGARLWLVLLVLATSHLLSLLDGLLVLCDKATHAVRLLHPLTGALAEFPVITHVLGRDGAPVAMDAFRARFHGLGPDPPNGYNTVYPAFNTVLTSAGLNESTSPPTLQLPVRDEAWLVLRAKPGDAHWVAWLAPSGKNNQIAMLRYAYRYALVS